MSFLYKPFCGHSPSRLLGKHLGVQLLDHTVGVCFNFTRNYCLVSQVVIAFYISISTVRAFHWFLASILSLFNLRHPGGSIVTPGIFTTGTYEHVHTDTKERSQQYWVMPENHKQATCPTGCNGYIVVCSCHIIKMDEVQF